MTILVLETLFTSSADWKIETLFKRLRPSLFHAFFEYRLLLRIITCLYLCTYCKLLLKKLLAYRNWYDEIYRKRTSTIYVFRWIFSEFSEYLFSEHLRRAASEYGTHQTLEQINFTLLSSKPLRLYLIERRS